MLISELSIVTNKTKSKLLSLPFVTIKNTILGNKYDLSIVILSAKKQREINKTYRGINKTTNILSFPLSKNKGEITFDLNKVKKDAPLFNMSYIRFFKYLLIHGLLHLKGFEHSSIMKKEEKKFLDLLS